MKPTDEIAGKVLTVQKSLESLGADVRSVRRFTEEVNAMQARITNSVGLQRFIEEANRNRELFRAALGPSEEIRRMLSSIQRPRVLTVLEELSKATMRYETRFRLPAVEETVRLMTEHHDRIAEIARLHCESFSQIQRAVESIRSPWLNATRQLDSIRSLASLQGIGRAVQTMPAFDERLSDVLRSNLGDWRDHITLPEQIHDDITGRTELYVERGFDTSLTDFPAEAFNEALDTTELRTQPPPIVVAYGLPVPVSDEEQEAGFKRTNAAHDWLQRMESRLRAFIDEIMTDAHGADWPRHRLPNGLYDQWRDKKQRAEGGDQPSLPLIAYADFTDYEQVICKRDNWPLFAPTFGKTESVRESLQRLYPIRLCTMHARLITQDDQMFLYVEVKRLIRAIARL